MGGDKRNTDDEVYLLGIDVGTSSCRSIIFGTECRAVGRAQKEISTNYLKPDWVEQDPEEWWDAVANTIRKALDASNVPPENVKCLSMSGQTDGMVAVDEKCEPLRPYISWMDRRCLPLKPKWSQFPPLAPTFKILWIKENEPKIFNETYKFLQTGDYTLYQLTGKFGTDYSYASHLIGLFDWKEMKWSEENAKMFGIPKHKLPDIHTSHEIIGKITNEAAEKTGLTTNTLVATGGGDNECSALGAGVINDGQALLSLGTSSVISICAEKPIFDLKFRLWGGLCHVIPDKWLLEGGVSGGAALKWFKEEFGQIETQVAESLGISPYEIMDSEAEMAKPEPDMPLFMLPAGIIFGLTFKHGRKHLIRAIMEGVAFEVRKIMEVADELNISINELRVVGGGAKSRVWLQIIADLMGRPVLSMDVKETAALGAAILAGVGAGIYANFSKVPQLPIYTNTPRDEMHSIYKELYRKYREFLLKVKTEEG